MSPRSAIKDDNQSVPSSAPSNASRSTDIVTTTCGPFVVTESDYPTA
jgi:hypothetical protein